MLRRPQLCKALCEALCEAHADRSEVLAVHDPFTPVEINEGRPAEPQIDRSECGPKQANNEHVLRAKHAAARCPTAVLLVS